MRSRSVQPPAQVVQMIYPNPNPQLSDRPLSAHHANQQALFKVTTSVRDKVLLCINDHQIIHFHQVSSLCRKLAAEGELPSVHYPHYLLILQGWGGGLAGHVVGPSQD